MKQVRMGIIGLGAIGQRLIPSFKSHKGIHIRGVFDLDRACMDRVCKAHDLLSFDEAKSLIDHEDIDAIYLAVPPQFHKELALEIMAAGKHLLCEKPLAASLEEAKAMAEAEKEFSGVTAMNFPLPYTGAYKALKDVLAAQALGKLLRVEVKGVFPHWPRLWQVNPWINTRAEGGFVREVFTHFIQVIVSNLGPIEDIVSRVDYPQEADVSETSVLAWGTLGGSLPVSFNGLAGLDQEEYLALRFIGDQGSLEIMNWRRVFMTNQDQGRREIEVEALDATLALIDAFYKAICQEKAPLVSLETGYETVKIVEGLLQTSK